MLHPCRIESQRPTDPDGTITLNVLQPPGNCIPLVIQRKDIISEVIKTVKLAIPVESDHIVELIKGVMHFQNSHTGLECALNGGASLTVVAANATDVTQHGMISETMRINALNLELDPQHH